MSEKNVVSKDEFFIKYYLAKIGRIADFVK